MWFTYFTYTLKKSLLTIDISILTHTGITHDPKQPSKGSWPTAKISLTFTFLPIAREILHAIATPQPQAIINTAIHHHTTIQSCNCRTKAISYRRTKQSSTRQAFTIRYDIIITASNHQHGHRTAPTQSSTRCRRRKRKSTLHCRPSQVKREGSWFTLIAKDIMRLNAFLTTARKLWKV